MYAFSRRVPFTRREAAAQVLEQYFCLAGMGVRQWAHRPASGFIPAPPVARLRELRGMAVDGLMNGPRGDAHGLTDLAAGPLGPPGEHDGGFDAGHPVARSHSAMTALICRSAGWLLSITREPPSLGPADKSAWSIACLPSFSASSMAS